MTERRSRSSVPVAWLSLSAFVVVLAFLALQLKEGRDPSIGEARAPAPAPREVLLRRIVRRKVVVHVIPPRIVDAPPAAVTSGASPAVAAAAPAQSSSAPAPVQAAAPAPVRVAPPVAAAPPPPPPPAPVTRSS
jgi:hypothetical protein